jgi:hypothetical protein
LKHRLPKTATIYYNLSAFHHNVKGVYAMGQRKVVKRIHIHPPEADAIAMGFTKVRSNLFTVMDSLHVIHSLLDNNWAGRAKDVFIQEPAAEKNHISRVIPHLDDLINKYRRYEVEVEVEMEEIIYDSAP